MDSPKTFKHVNFEFKNPVVLEQINENNTRVYKSDKGIVYPSVTTIMSWISEKSIAEWKAKVGEEEANKVSKQATSLGTDLHNLCEKYIDNSEEIGPVLPDALEVFNNIKKVIDKNVDNVYCQETKLYSDYMGVAGTTDCIAEYNGVLSIIDFKTSRKIKKESYIKNYFMQAAAYAVMFEELTGVAVPQIVIIMGTADDHKVFIKKRNEYIFDFIKVVQDYKKYQQDLLTKI